MLWMQGMKQSGIEGNPIVTDLESIALCLYVHMPAYAIDHGPR